MKIPYLKKLFLVCLSVCLWMGSVRPAYASEEALSMLKQVVGQVQSSLQAKRLELKNNPNLVYTIVNQYILPHVDFAEMGRWVVGRNAWNAANPTTQQAFIKEFRTTLIRAYAFSLIEANDQKVEFLPRVDGSADRIQIHSIVRGSKTIRMDYRLIKSSNGWKVYDIIFEGVSLMQGYRAQFEGDIQRGGLEAVVETLKAYNSGKKQLR